MGGMSENQQPENASLNEPGRLVPTRLYPGGEIYWVEPARPHGKPRPGHGILYVNPASDLPDSEWSASWEDDYPVTEIAAHGGATVGTDYIVGSEDDVLRWARTRPAKKHLIIRHGKWVGMPLDENRQPD